MSKRFIRTTSDIFELADKNSYLNSIIFIEDKLLIWSNGKYYAANVDWHDVLNNPIKTDGAGNKFLSDDGTYKSVTTEVVKFLSNTQLKFYCVEPVTVIVGEDVEEFPANSMISKTLNANDMFSIVPTSDNSILTLDAWPGPLQQWYSWLEGVSLFSNIIFNMNVEELYTKWNQGHQGQYHVLFAQYKNCIFWSDLAYISDVSLRTNYTLYYSSEIPLCYSQIPDNTFKSFYLAYNATSDPNWSNPVYKESFSKATWATQVFSYYGMHSIGLFDMSTLDFNIVLPKDCRGLCYHAPNILNLGVLDAINATNFGAKSGSWREAFGECICLLNLYIINLKTSLNISWSPINLESINFIVNGAVNTNSITISLSPYTYYGLSQETKDLATSKNITLELITTNYDEDRRTSSIILNGDGDKYLSDDGTYKVIETGENNVQSDWNTTDTTSDAYIKNKPNLSEVATSGDYNSLINIPELALVATSGDYNDLINKPDADELTTDTIINLGFTPSHLLATVATSGDYYDLLNIPPDKTLDDTMSDTSENAVENKVIKSYIDTKTSMLVTNGDGAKYLTNDGTYDFVYVFERLYTEYSYECTQQGITPMSYEQFLTRMMTNLSVETPTKTSQLTNNSGFITSDDIPTKTSELTNDSGFIDNNAFEPLNETVEKLSLDKNAKVLWIGTSIPAGDIQHNNNGTTQSVTTDLGSNNYPKMVADALGFTLYNNARGSSFVCFYPPEEDGTNAWAGASDWTEYQDETWKGFSLAASFAQVDEKFGPNGLNCPEWLINQFKSYSYESLIIPYIDGTLASCDTVVIDHGYNDRLVIINQTSWYPGEGETQFTAGAGRSWLKTLQDPFEQTLTTESHFQSAWWNDESVNSKKHYFNAIIFICKKIWAVNPRIKIIIGNYFTKKSNVFGAEYGNDKLGEFVCLANSAIANWLQVKCVNVADQTGLYNRNLAAGNDYSLFCPDGVHPHSDTTGKSNKVIAGIYINELKGLLYN